MVIAGLGFYQVGAGGSPTYTIISGEALAATPSEDAVSATAAEDSVTATVVDDTATVTIP